MDLKDAYFHIPIVKYCHHFLQLVWQNMPYQWKVLPFGMATTPRVFTALTKPTLYLCHSKGVYTVIYLDDILVLVHSKWAGNRAHSFLCFTSLPWITYNLQSLSFASLRLFVFWRLCWDTVHMLVPLQPDKLADIQQLGLTLLHTQPVMGSQVMSFLGKANFCANGHSQL